MDLFFILFFVVVNICVILICSLFSSFTQMELSSKIIKSELSTIVTKQDYEKNLKTIHLIDCKYPPDCTNFNFFKQVQNKLIKFFHTLKKLGKKKPKE